MSKLFQNSGMLFLIITSFMVIDFKPAVDHAIFHGTYVEHDDLLALSKQINDSLHYVATNTPNPQPYGIFTQEIEQILSVTPSDSEIYIEEREGGGWYLKIEKLFSTEEQASGASSPLVSPTEKGPSEQRRTDDAEPFTPSPLPSEYPEDSLLV